MLWSYNQVEEFRKYRSGAKILIGMNEVNQPHQSNLNPQQGWELWNQEIRPLGKQGHTLVSPSVTCQPSGLQWLKEFFAGCGGDDMCGVRGSHPLPCSYPKLSVVDKQVDILNIHIYVNSAAQVIKDIKLYYETFRKPIWLTEYACQV